MRANPARLLWFILCLSLAACGQRQATDAPRVSAVVTPTATASPCGRRLSCFADVILTPFNGQPPRSQAQAEADARVAYQRQPGQLGPVVDAYTATIVQGVDPRQNQQDPYRGWNVWVLIFDRTPTQGLQGSLPSGFANRATIMIDIATGKLGRSCADLTRT